MLGFFRGPSVGNEVWEFDKVLQGFTGFDLTDMVKFLMSFAHFLLFRCVRLIDSVREFC